MKNLKFSYTNLFVIALLVALPAFLINLGKQPFIDDEAIRALVAFEMLEKGDFITPTIAGEPYLKKPPLYNWIIAFFFTITDQYDEFIVRLPMVLFLFLFSLAIFYYFRKEVDTRFGVISALVFMTTGRMLVYEAFHGLIDVAFSFLIFIFFMEVFTKFRQGRIISLYLLAYFMIALAFLMKGLPSVVFLGLTLLVLFISNKRFKLLFHWSHFIGVLLFIFIVGLYYLAYFNSNEISPKELFSVIIGESTRRTAFRFGFWQTVVHLLAFPFEMLYHFLPWSLLIVFIFKRDAIRTIRKHPFLRYLSLVFIINLIPYWLSPEFYPRYILMLVPLLFAPFIFIYLKNNFADSKIRRITDYLFGVLILLSVISGFIPFFTPVHESVSGVYIISTGLIVVTGFLAYFYWRFIQFRLITFAILLLVLRIAFDLVVIPVRLSDSNEIEAKNMAREVVDITRDKPLNFYWNPAIDENPYYGYRVTSYRFNYYIFLFRQEVVKTITSKNSGGFYIAPDYFIKGKNVQRVKQFRPAGHGTDLVLFRFNPD